MKELIYAIREVQRWLRQSGVDPNGVGMVLEFKDKGQRELAWAMLEHEADNMRLHPTMEKLNAHQIHGMSFAMRTKPKVI